MCGEKHFDCVFDRFKRSLVKDMLVINVVLAFANPVVMAGGPHLIPSRTQSLSPRAPMVLRLKARESRSLPGL